MNYERLGLLGRGYVGSCNRRNWFVDLKACLLVRFVWTFLKIFGLVFQSVD